MVGSTSIGSGSGASSQTCSPWIVSAILLPYDVITELWFEDEALFRGTLDYRTSSSMPDEIAEDEKQLFLAQSLEWPR